MIRKILEAFFRHKLLILMPTILIPAIVSPIAVLAMPPLYDTAVSVWVDRPTYLTYKDTSNPYVSQVQTQVARLGELLRTRAFLVDVAGRTSLAPLVGSTDGEQRISDLVTKSVTVGGGGVTAAANIEHLLVIHVQAATPELSFELCQAIINAYQERTSADQSDQAGVAVDFYQSSVQDAQTQLNVASQNLRRYLAAHPTDADGTDLTQLTPQAALLDPKLGALETSVQMAQTNVNTAQAALTQAQHDSLASVQGQQLGFQILDAPQMPTTPTPQTKKIIIYPIAAAVVGLGLSAMLLVLLVATDRSVHSELDLTNGLRMLGTVPRLDIQRVPKKLRGVATRRAMGAAAGTALPAPGGAL